MPVNVADIAVRDWSPRLFKYGEIVQDVDDIAQALRLCWLTPYGSVPIRRDFGSIIHRWLDKPFQVARANIPASVVEAAIRWEPRAAIDSVTVTQIDVSGLQILIEWHPKDAPDFAQTTAITQEQLQTALMDTSVLRATIDSIMNAAFNPLDFMRKSEYASATQQGVVKAAEKLAATGTDNKHYETEIAEQGRIISKETP